MSDESTKRPPTVEEFRKNLQAEHQQTAKQIAEDWLRGLPARPQRIKVKASTPTTRQQNFLPGIEPRPRPSKRGG